MGSNSFHMVVARLVHGEIFVHGKMGEKFRLERLDARTA